MMKDRIYITTASCYGCSTHKYDEEDRDTGSFIGDSYRDLTRIAI